MKVHEVKVTFGAGPLQLTTRAVVANASQRDSVVAWAREQGHEVGWQTIEIPPVLDAAGAITAIATEIRESLGAMGEG